jgi:serine/threonine protein kinase
MTLAAGTRLGSYEIVSSLGAGGMGEVYRAKDTRLEREVAVKVLPAHLSSSEEMRQRFEREAKTISQLSHPHICALYDVGSHEGTEYLVMELLEGETLAARLTKGALPLDQTLRFGFEMADALDKAHRQGIVHRDLKPGNVMLTKTGVKLLDFGLAKALPSPPGEAAEPARSLVLSEHSSQGARLHSREGGESLGALDDGTEHRGDDSLLTVAKCQSPVFRRHDDLDEEAVDPLGQACGSQVGDEVGIAGSVRRVDDDRERREPADGADGGQIKGRAVV